MIYYYSQWSPLVFASYASCLLMKKCARRTYDELGRGMLTSDMVDNISIVASEMFK